MLKKIAIENYRSCLRTKFDLHPKLSVLIGPNGSGKTNILQGIMLLNKMVQMHGPHVLPEDHITTTSRIRAVFGAGDTEARLNASVSTYAGDANNEILLRARQKWVVRGARGKRFSIEGPLGLAAHLGEEELAFRLFLARRHRHFVKTGTVAGQIPDWARSAFGAVERYCSQIKYYGASQFTNPGICPASFEIELEGRSRSLRRTRGHAKTLYAMYAAKKADSSSYRRFIDIVGAKGLRLIDGLSFREVRSSSTEYSVRIGGGVERRRRYNLLVVPQFRIGRQTLSPNQLSEGTFKTLALLFHLMTEDSTALLIEEPEVCIHHGLLSSILEIVKSQSEYKQIILSTHSDYVLDRVGPENVYRVGFERVTGTAARHIRRTMTRKEFAALRRYLEQVGNLGDYWREGGVGGAIMNIGIIAEDESDVAVLREITSKLLRPRKVGYKWHVGHGCGKLRRKCGAWAESLVRRGCPWIVVAHDLDASDERRLRRDLEQAVAQADAAASVVLIPREEIEAWLLYDGWAIARAFRQSERPPLPGNPEAVSDPKKYLRDLVWRRYRKDYLHTLHNGPIAKQVDPSSLERSNSFSPHFEFARLVKAALR